MSDVKRLSKDLNQRVKSARAQPVYEDEEPVRKKKGGKKK